MNPKLAVDLFASAVEKQLSSQGEPRYNIDSFTLNQNRLIHPEPTQGVEKHIVSEGEHLYNRLNHTGTKRTVQGSKHKHSLLLKY